jgi:hypothetical protein
MSQPGSALAAAAARVLTALTGRAVLAYAGLADRAVLCRAAYSEPLALPRGPRLADLLRALPRPPAEYPVLVLRSREGLRQDARSLVRSVGHFLNSSCTAFEGLRLWGAVRSLGSFAVLAEAPGQVRCLLGLCGEAPGAGLDALSSLAESLRRTPDGCPLTEAFAAARRALPGLDG